MHDWGINIRYLYHLLPHITTVPIIRTAIWREMISRSIKQRIRKCMRAMVQCDVHHVLPSFLR